MAVQVTRIEAPSGGLNTEAAPDYVAKNEAPLLRNLIPRPGKAVMRGPLRLYSGTTGATSALSGLWSWTDPVSASSAVFARHSGTPDTYYRFDPSAANGTSPTSFGNGGNTNLRIGQSFTQLGAFLYGQNSLNTALMTIDPATNALALYSNAPFTRIYAVETHLNRLFVLGSDANGEKALYWSVPFTGNAVSYWLSPAAALPDTAAAWQDTVSGLTNKIIINGRGDQAIGLASFSGGLLILLNRSVLILRGKTPSSFQLDEVTREMGGTSVLGIAKYVDSVFFSTSAGLVSYDGAQTSVVSTPLNSEYLSYRNPRQASGDISVTKFEGDWLLVASLGGYFSRLYHTRTGVWCELTCDLMQGQAPKQSVLYGSGNAMWDGSRLWYTTGEVTQPETAATSARGFDILGATKAAVPALWRSRLARLSPSAKVTLNRVLLDYSWDTSSPSGQPGWYVQLFDGRSNNLGTETQVAANTGTVQRSRFQGEHYNETTDVQIQVSYRVDAGTPPPVLTAEIHDSFVEFQPAQQRGNA